MQMIPMALSAAAGAAGAGTAVAGFAQAAMMAGTILSAVGQVGGAIGAKNAANFEAKQMISRAGSERATSQRAAAEERRQKNIVQSRAQAVAAASGGGASDPTVVDLQGDLEVEGEYRALSQLYEGEERARGLIGAASAKKVEGRQALTGGLIGAAGTILSGAESLYSNYGTKRPGGGSSYYPKSKTWVDWN